MHRYLALTVLGTALIGCSSTYHPAASHGTAVAHRTTSAPIRVPAEGMEAASAVPTARRPVGASSVATIPSRHGASDFPELGSFLYP